LIGERLLKLNIFNTLLKAFAKSIPQKKERTPHRNGYRPEFWESESAPETVQLRGISFILLKVLTPGVGQINSGQADYPPGPVKKVPLPVLFLPVPAGNAERRAPAPAFLIESMLIFTV
jgi:hypothetical protein